MHAHSAAPFDILWSMTRVILSLFIAGAFSLGGGGCAPLKLVRISGPEPGGGPPRIDRLVDLGGLPLPAMGQVIASASDGRFTPGEWIAVVGRNLHGASRIKLAGRDLPVEGFVQGGSLLARLPAGLDSRIRHRLEVTTAGGTAGVELSVHRYLITAEPDGMVLHFIPIGPDTELSMGREAAELQVKNVEGVVVSADGAMAYALEQVIHEEETGHRAKITAIHLGARGGPQALGQTKILTDSAPHALAVTGSGSIMVLCRQEILHLPLDGSPPLSMVPVRPRRPGGEVLFTDLEMLAGGGEAVLLDALGNRLVRVKFGRAGAPPKVTGVLNLARDLALPLSIDMAADPEVSGAVWVLQGPNFRVAGEKLNRALRQIKVKVLSSVYEVESEDAPTLSRVVRVNAGGTGEMKITAEVPLPDAFYPFQLLAGKGGELLVSGAGTRVLEFSKLKPTADVIKNALELVVDTPQFGRIIRIKPGARASLAVKGVMLYFGLAALPDGTLIYSLLRPGVSITSPFLAADWGVESADGGYLRLRRMGWNNLIPPYQLGVLVLQ